MRRAIASQFVGDQPPWRASLTLQQLTEKPFRRTLVASGLDQDIDHITILIDAARNDTGADP